jgi:hypothetical protein
MLRVRRGSTQPARLTCMGMARGCAGCQNAANICQRAP